MEATYMLETLVHNNPVPGGITEPPVPGGYKCGNLAIQVGGVSDETVKYGYGFRATRTIE
jgi:hypothetical protein